MQCLLSQLENRSAASSTLSAAVFANDLLPTSFTKDERPRITFADILFPRPSVVHNALTADAYVSFWRQLAGARALAVPLAHPITTLLVVH